MKRALIPTAAAAVLLALVQPAAIAQKADAKSEAKQRGCFNCHDIEKKKMGPALQDSAAKFRNKSAADLAASIKSKPVHASALKSTGDKELNVLAEWILTLGK